MLAYLTCEGVERARLTNKLGIVIQVVSATLVSCETLCKGGARDDVAEDPIMVDQTKQSMASKNASSPASCIENRAETCCRSGIVFSVPHDERPGTGFLRRPSHA